MPDDQYLSLPFDRLEQFAFAKGEEVILSRYNTAESVSTAIGQAFSEEDVLTEYLDRLMLLVAEQKKLKAEDFKALNELTFKTIRAKNG